MYASFGKVKKVISQKLKLTFVLVVLKFFGHCVHEKPAYAFCKVRLQNKNPESWNPFIFSMSFFYSHPFQRKLSHCVYLLNVKEYRNIVLWRHFLVSYNYSNKWHTKIMHQALLVVLNPFNFSFQSFIGILLKHYIINVIFHDEKKLL